MPIYNLKSEKIAIPISSDSPLGNQEVIIYEKRFKILGYCLPQDFNSFKTQFGAATTLLAKKRLTEGFLEKISKAPEIPAQELAGKLMLILEQGKTRLMSSGVIKSVEERQKQAL